MEISVGISDDTKFYDIVRDWIQRHQCNVMDCNEIVVSTTIDKDTGSMTFWCATHG